MASDSLASHPDAGPSGGETVKTKIALNGLLAVFSVVACGRIMRLPWAKTTGKVATYTYKHPEEGLRIADARVGK